MIIQTCDCYLPVSIAPIILILGVLFVGVIIWVLFDSGKGNNGDDLSGGQV